MHTLELLLASLNQRYDEYLTERKQCKDDFSEEAVHDFRVATRRLLAIIDLLHNIVQHPALQKLRRTLKDQLDSLDNLRDTQVMLVEISETLATLPELLILQKFLQKREKRLLKFADDEIRDLKTKTISNCIEKIRSALNEPTKGLELSERLLAVVDDVCLTINRRKERVDPAQPFTIHSVRVVFKKFRYMIEIIHPILTAFPESHLKRMHDYQISMGEIQDVEVLLRTLDDYAASHKDYDPQRARFFYEQRHSELINAYIENMNEFVTFWREMPDKAFPWESKYKDKP
jgi:CHAD domain-containing protein